MNVKDTAYVLSSKHNWKIWADFEAVTLENPTGQRWKIGEMYGNPQAGLITSDERYAVIIGCGIMIADLSRFGERISGSGWPKTPVIHLLCEPPGTFFEAVYEPGEPGHLRVVKKIGSEQGGVYELQLPDLRLKPLIVGSLWSSE